MAKIDIKLYPTETLYALGVDALDPKALDRLYNLKDRETDKSVSWAVTSIDDIEKWAELGDRARAIATAFLPGPLTLVLRVKKHVSSYVCAKDRTVGFRIPADETALRVITKHIKEKGTPLTCTSANISGAPTMEAPELILQQFGSKANLITTIIDDGPRKGLASTVVRCIDNKVEITREGQISPKDISKVL